MLSSTATVHVLVEDDNDESPQFSPNEYKGGKLGICIIIIAVKRFKSDVSPPPVLNCSEVSTSAPPDTSILSVSATDNDRSREFSTVSQKHFKNFGKN